MSINLFLQNNPNLRPRDEVRIERVVATPYPDRHRVHVEVEVTPFREQPNLEITISDQHGRVAASATVVALMSFKVAFNLHLRGADDPAGYTWCASSFTTKTWRLPRIRTRLHWIFRRWTLPAVREPWAHPWFSVILRGHSSIAWWTKKNPLEAAQYSV